MPAARISLRLDLLALVAFRCSTVAGASSHRRSWNLNPIDLSREPAPPPDKGPPLSAHASRDRSLLPAQICGILGAYCLTVLVLGVLLLTYGRKMRRQALNPGHNEKLEIEMIKSPNRIMDPSPASPSSIARTFMKSPKKAFKKSVTSLSSNGSHTANNSIAGSQPGSPTSPGMHSITSFDAHVVQQNREAAQKEMERLYAAVMEHDAKQGANVVYSADGDEIVSGDKPVNKNIMRVKTDRGSGRLDVPSGLNSPTSPTHPASPRSPVRAIYPPDTPLTGGLTSPRAMPQYPPGSPKDNFQYPAASPLPQYPLGSPSDNFQYPLASPLPQHKLGSLQDNFQYPAPSPSIKSPGLRSPGLPSPGIKSPGLPSPGLASPRSPAHPPQPRTSRTSSIGSSSSKTRRALRNLRISAPIKHGEPDDEERTPLSPRFYNPGAPPSPPTQPPTPHTGRTTTTVNSEEAYERLDMVQPLPRPNPQRSRSGEAEHQQTDSGSPATSTSGGGGGALPLRAAFGSEPLASPSATKTTFLERKRDMFHRGPLTGATPRTGQIPPTPYSAYMPFTPVTPVTPHLVTKKERKMQKKQVKKLGAVGEERMVQAEDDLWGS